MEWTCAACGVKNRGAVQCDCCGLAVPMGLVSAPPMVQSAPLPAVTISPTAISVKDRIMKDVVAGLPEGFKDCPLGVSTIAAAEWLVSQLYTENMVTRILDAVHACLSQTMTEARMRVKLQQHMASYLSTRHLFYAFYALITRAFLWHRFRKPSVRNGRLGRVTFSGLPQWRVNGPVARLLDSLPPHVPSSVRHLIEASSDEVIEKAHALKPLTVDQLAKWQSMNAADLHGQASSWSNLIHTPGRAEDEKSGPSFLASLLTRFGNAAEARGVMGSGAGYDTISDGGTSSSASSASQHSFSDSSSVMASGNGSMAAMLRDMHPRKLPASIVAVDSDGNDSEDSRPTIVDQNKSGLSVPSLPSFSSSKFGCGPSVGGFQLKQLQGAKLLALGRPPSSSASSNSSFAALLAAYAPPGTALPMVSASASLPLGASLAAGQKRPREEGVDDSDSSVEQAMTAGAALPATISPDGSSVLSTSTMPSPPSTMPPPPPVSATPPAQSSTSKKGAASIASPEPPAVVASPVASTSVSSSGATSTGILKRVWIIEDISDDDDDEQGTST